MDSEILVAVRPHKVNEKDARRRGRSKKPRKAGVGKPRPKTRSELDAQHRVANLLERRGFEVSQDIYIAEIKCRADIYAERVDLRLLIEMKAPGSLNTEAQRNAALDQLYDYSDVLEPPYAGISDGDILILDFEGQHFTHQLIGGLLLPAESSGSPLDVGASYQTFAQFPTNQRGASSSSGPQVERSQLFDLETFLSEKGPDIIFVAGESGAGKTTYVRQLVGSQFDPLWVDCALTEDAVKTISDAVAETGYPGTTTIFLETLRLYRERDGSAPSGIVLDAVDEWARFEPRLYALIVLATRARLKLIVIGRPQIIDLILKTGRVVSGRRFERFDLGLFDADERTSAEIAYREHFSLQSSFEGRALQMSRLPAMMAAISETYEGSSINPELTEPQLYNDYRALKASKIAIRLSISTALVESDIDALALRMLELDRVALSYPEARQVANSVDALVSEGLLLSRGPDRSLRIQFRFGRFRDDALASKVESAKELFRASVVGRSALIYAAASDARQRRELIDESLREDLMEAIVLVKEFGWWNDLSDALPENMDDADRFKILVYAGATLRQHPVLLSRLGADPRAPRFAAVHHVAVPLETWRSWIVELEDIEKVNNLCEVAFEGLKSDISWLDDCIRFAQAASDRYVRSDRFSGGAGAFWTLAQEICVKLEPVAARRFLRSVLPSFSLVHSTGGNPTETFYHNLDYPSKMLDTVDVVRKKSTPKAFEAWATAILLIAYIREQPGFDGYELSGPGTIMGRYEDNGWLLDTIVPALQSVLRSSKLDRRLSAYRISRLHPAFRLRALILTAPIEVLDGIPAARAAWRALRRTGIPSLNEVLDSRASESEEIATEGLETSLREFGQPVSDSDVRVLHRRLARGSRKAIKISESFLTNRAFIQQDHFTTRFFDTLNWANTKPLLAARFLAIATKAGYPFLFLAYSDAYNHILGLALQKRSVRRALDGVPDIQDQLAHALRTASPATRQRQTLAIYETAGEAGKTSILQWVHELPIGLAAKLMRKAILADAPEDVSASSDDDISNHVLPSGRWHYDAWTALAHCGQQWRGKWFHKLGLDVAREASCHVSPVAIAATLRALVSFAGEYQKDPTQVQRVADRLIAWGENGGRKLRSLIATNLIFLYPGMGASQRLRFLDVLWDTRAVAEASLQIARVLRTQDDVDRVLMQATSNPNRYAIADLLWREIDERPRSLTELESVVVQTLTANAEKETLRELGHLAAAISKHSPEEGTALLLAVLRRSLAVSSELPAPYQMTYAWQLIPENDVMAFCRDIASHQNPSWLAVQCAGDALAQGMFDEAKTKEAFELLVTKHSYVRESYARWRQGLAE